MTNRWTWASVLALCIAPVVAQARDRGREGGDARERHPSPGRQADRADPQPDRSDRRSRSRSPQGRQYSPTPQRPDRGNQATHNDDSGRGARNFDRRGSSRGNWGGWSGDRHDDHQWRGSYRHDEHSYGSFGYRPRYPGHYRYGYFYGHGYYFPRYYFDLNVYPAHGSIRMLVEPSQTEVYVDGYYAGVVDDFDGLFQRLQVAPGRHQVTLRLDGYQTWSAEVYATPEGTLNVRHDMLPGPSGEYGGDYGPDPRQYEAPGADEGPAAGDEPPPQQ